MVYRNAQNEAPAAWGNQENCLNEFDGNRNRGIGWSSPETRSQPFSASGADRQGTDSYSDPGGSHPGKIVADLIVETRNQIEASQSHVEKLKKQLKQLEKLSEQLTPEEPQENTEDST